MSLIGIAFAIVAPWAAGLSYESSGAGASREPTNVLAAVAIWVLVYKRFTTITNSGGELVEPAR